MSQATSAAAIVPATIASVITARPGFAALPDIVSLTIAAAVTAIAVDAATLQPAPG